MNFTSGHTELFPVRDVVFRQASSDLMPVAGHRKG